MDRLWAIEVFVRVVECGSFNKAAESLNLANASVTECIRNLENYLGVALIQRNTRFLHLTEEGKLYFERGVRLLKDAAEAEAEVRSRIAEVTGTVRVEAPVAIGHEFLSRSLREFSQRHPTIEVSMLLADDPRNMIERGTDVAVRMDAVEDANLVARLLSESHYVACASPAYIKMHGLPRSPMELDPASCLGVLARGRYTPIAWKFFNSCSEVDVVPEGPIHFNNSHSLVTAALGDVGIICVLDVYVRHHLVSGKLLRLFPEWNTPSRTFYAVTPQSRFVPPKVRIFIDHLTQVFQREQGDVSGVGHVVRLRNKHSREDGAPMRPRSCPT